MIKKKSKIQHICNNCKLYDPERGICRIVILWEGSKTNLPVSPTDTCFYESVDGWSGEKFIEDVKEVKFWVENAEGEKIDGDGIVRMEYPQGFFGEDQ